MRAAALLSLLSIALLARADPPLTDGQRLTALLDATQVETRWPAHQHVDWQTGIPDGKPEHGTGKHTHCSAFVAAIAMRLGVYILRPPDHSQVLLANAQSDWLASDGAKQGWQPLPDARAAQEAANRGMLVVASYRNHHDDVPGHIAIVRPSDKSADALRDEGPEIIQAGMHNFRDTTARTGFAGHPAALGENELRYHAHSIDWARLGSAPK